MALSLSNEEKSAFEAFFEKADADKDGLVGPDDAKSFYASFGLPAPVLGQIWRTSNPEQNEGLNKQDFFLSLRLVAQAQAGQSLDAESARTTSTGVPKVAGAAPAADAAPAGGEWRLEASQKVPFDQVYEASAEQGFVSGQKAKELFVSYGLPIADLKRIWELSDADKDQQLSHHEFLVAMYLIFKKKQGEAVPAAVPPSLNASVAALLGGDTATTTTTTTPVAVEESRAMTATERAWYEKVYEETAAGEARMASDKVMEVWLKSGQPPALLRNVWTQVDSQSGPGLDKESFVKGMHLINLSSPTAAGAGAGGASPTPTPPLSSSGGAVPASPRSNSAPTGVAAAAGGGGLLGRVRDAQARAQKAQQEAREARTRAEQAENALAEARQALVAEQAAAQEAAQVAQARTVELVEEAMAEERALHVQLEQLTTQLTQAAAREEEVVASLRSQAAALRVTTNEWRSRAAHQAQRLATAQASALEAATELDALQQESDAAAASLSSTATNAMDLVMSDPFADAGGASPF